MSDLEQARATAQQAAELAAKLAVENEELVKALRPIAAAYPDDPGTSDLDNEQPVVITLGDVRRAWRALARHKVAA